MGGVESDEGVKSSGGVDLAIEVRPAKVFRVGQRSQASQRFRVRYRGWFVCGI